MAATNPLLQNILCPKFSFRIFSLQKNISPKVLFFFPFFKVCVGSPSSKYPPQTPLLSKNFFTSFSTFSRPSFLILQPPTPPYHATFLTPVCISSFLSFLSSYLSYLSDAPFLTQLCASHLSTSSPPPATMSCHLTMMG